MLCCPNCFDDVYIRQIFPLYSDTEGDCELCGSKEQLLARPVFFKELFENIVDTYVPDSTGKSLVERFQEDWELFPLDRIDIRTAQLLLGEILDDGNIVRQKFSLPRSADDNISEKWDLFRYELKHQNRFFTEQKPDFETLTTLLQYIYLVPEELPNYWYRSRLSKGD
ncbi:RES domain-containing protein, partial [Alkalimonas sp. MEB004]|nr:RES domain-containing protein [Alkalimonas sp. MEB004]